MEYSTSEYDSFDAVVQLVLDTIYVCMCIEFISISSILSENN